MDIGYSGTCRQVPQGKTRKSMSAALAPNSAFVVAIPALVPELVSPVTGLPDNLKFWHELTPEEAIALNGFAAALDSSVLGQLQHDVQSLETAFKSLWAAIVQPPSREVCMRRDDSPPAYPPPSPSTFVLTRGTRGHLPGMCRF